MPFGDQLQATIDKLASGQRVPPEELNQLRLDGNNLSAAASNFAMWSDAQGNMDPNLFLQHSRGFSASPLGGIKVQAVSQSIPDSSGTALSWSTRQFQHGADFGWDSGDPTKLRTTAARGRDVLFAGNAVFATNSSGYRNLNFSQFQEDGTIIGGLTLVQSPAVSGIETVLPFAAVIEVHIGNGGYFLLKALQNSGGNLDVTYAELSAFVLW